MNDRHLRRRTKATKHESAVERYDFRTCPLSQWSFPSIVTGVADLVATSDHPWSCGHRSGLKLSSGVPGAYLETPVLDLFWSRFVSLSVDENSSLPLTVSLWFQPNNAEDNFQDAMVRPIVTWTKATENNNNNNNIEGCPGFELQIASYKDRLLIRYSDQDQARSCRILYLRQIQLSNLFNKTFSNQFVFTLAAGSTSIHLNGHEFQRNLSNSFHHSPVKSWQSTRLEVFGSSLTSQQGLFRGALHELSLYNTDLSSHKILQMYKQGIQSFQNESQQEDSGSWNWTSELSSVALPQPPTVLLQQASRNNVSIILVAPNGTNTSILGLYIEFVRLPLFGNLTWKEKPIRQRDRLPIPLQGAQDRFIVSYTLTNEAYFNTPKKNALGETLGLFNDESFAYRVVAVDGDGYIVAAMAEENAAKQTITVQHVNHPPLLLVPDEAELPSSTDILGPAQLICRNISVSDPRDNDLNLIRVDVTARHGRLTLNPNYRHMADFASCRGRSESPWQCLGNGVADRHMTFLAVPSHVELILQDLRYKGFSPGSSDTITLAIYDGADNQDCLSVEEHEANSRVVGSNAWSPLTRTAFDGCFHVNATIIVPQMTNLQNTDQSGGNSNDDETGIFGIPNSDLRKFDLADLLFWVILTIFLCALFFCCGRAIRKTLRFLGSRGTPIAINNEEPDPDQVCSARDQYDCESTTCDDFSDRVVVVVSRSRVFGLNNVEENDSDNSSLTNGSVGEASF